MNRGDTHVETRAQGGQAHVRHTSGSQRAVFRHRTSSHGRRIGNHLISGLGLLLVQLLNGPWRDQGSLPSKSWRCD